MPLVQTKKNGKLFYYYCTLIIGLFDSVGNYRYVVSTITFVSQVPHHVLVFLLPERDQHLIISVFGLKLNASIDIKESNHSKWICGSFLPE